MKFAQAFLIAVSCSFVFSSHALAQNKSGYATVVRIQGEARYSKGDAKWLPLTVGQTLTAGCVVQTAVNASVDLVLGTRISYHIDPDPAKVAPSADPDVRGLASYKAFAEQNVINVQSDSVLAIDKLTVSETGVDSVSDTELDLRKGTIFGNVKKLSAASQYLIKIPNGIAGVRGTTFMLSANGAITVINGSMVLSLASSNGQPTTIVLGPGDQYNPATGQTTHLTQAEMNDAEQMAFRITTVTEGIIHFASDGTLLYVSPVQGRSGNGPLPQ